MARGLVAAILWGVLFLPGGAAFAAPQGASVGECKACPPGCGCAAQGCDCPPSGGCGPCPQIIRVSINGVNAKVNDPFHHWVDENTPSMCEPMPPNGNPAVPIDPFDPTIKDEWCNADPSKAAEKLAEKIKGLKAANPCAKILIVGHSLGGVVAWYLREYADCSVYVDPPPCYSGGAAFCKSQRDACVDFWYEKPGVPRSIPNLVKTREHTPFNDPTNHCEDLRSIREALNRCTEALRPNCPLNDPGMEPCSTF